MIKALRVVMIIYAIIGILFGLAMIFIADQLREWFNYAQAPDDVRYFTTALGAMFISSGVFVFMAARDPIKNISWVKYAILLALLSLCAALYTWVRGYSDFSQVGLAMIIHAVFAALLFIFYPWRVRQGST